MYIYVLADIMLFVTSVKFPSVKFDTLNFVEFISEPTRSAQFKLRHKTASTNYEFIFFPVYPDFGTVYQ